MTRTIPKEQILPGMTIAWDKKGVTYTCEVTEVQARPLAFAMMVRSPLGGIAYVYSDTVEVIAEPQPKEPTAFGARVVVDGKSAIHAHPSDIEAWVLMDRDGETAPCSWRELCTLGPVTVVPDQGWTVPAGTPEVPERIEVWPKDDTALRKYKWRDRDGDTWTWIEDRVRWECRDHSGAYQTVCSRPYSWYRPWERVTDA